MTVYFVYQFEFLSHVTMHNRLMYASLFVGGMIKIILLNGCDNSLELHDILDHMITSHHDYNKLVILLQTLPHH